MPRLLSRGLPLLFTAWYCTTVAQGFFVQGTDNTNYLWFHNVILLGTALGLFLENRAILGATLGLYLFSATPWLIDNALRPFLKFNPLSLNEEMYRPGISTLEFILHHSLWFSLASLITGLRLTPRGNIRPWIPATVIATLLGVAFLYGSEKNVNYIHIFFVESLAHWRGPIYSIGFAISCVLLHTFCTRVSLRLFPPIPQDKKRSRRRLLATTTGAFLFSLAFLLFDFRYLKSLPQLICGEPFERQDVRIQCRYTNDFGANWVMMTYSMFNKTRVVLECASYYERQGNQTLIQDSLVIWPGKEIKLDILWPYPRETFTIKLSATCKPY